MSSFIDRLRERKVIQWALAYVAGGAVALELLGQVGDAWGFPPVLLRLAQALVAIGFVATLVLAWYHGQRGRQEVSGLELLILAALLASAALVITLVRPTDDERGIASANETETVDPDGSTVVLGVLPAQNDLQALRSSGWSGLIQRLLSSELARPRGLLVWDDLSLNTLLETADITGQDEPYGRLRQAGIQYAVRSTVTPAAEGIEVTYRLADTERGHILLTESFVNEDERELPAQVRQAALRIIEHLEETAGITKALDIQPWLASPPTSVEATRAFLLGTEYAYRGVRGGRPHYERALEVDPDFIAPRIWLVSSLIAAGDTAAAREHVEVLHSLESKATPFEQAMIGWADALVHWDLESMVRHLEVALSYSPRNNTLLYNLGFSLRRLGRTAEALVPLRRAVETRWNFPEVYPLYALTAIEAGEVQGLRGPLENALNRGPHGPTIYGILEALALFEGDREAAQQYGSTFREAFGDRDAVRTELVPAYRSLAELARARGDLETSGILLERAVRAAPGEPEVRLELARVAGEMGDFSAAEQYYESAVRIRTRDADVVYLLGEVAGILGRDEEAIDHFTRYLEMAPDGPDAIPAREHRRSLAGSR